MVLTLGRFNGWPDQVCTWTSNPWDENAVGHKVHVSPSVQFGAAAIPRLHRGRRMVLWLTRCSDMPSSPPLGHANLVNGWQCRLRTRPDEFHTSDRHSRLYRACGGLRAAAPLTGSSGYACAWLDIEHIRVESGWMNCTTGVSSHPDVWSGWQLLWQWSAQMSFYGTLRHQDHIAAKMCQLTE